MVDQPAPAAPDLIAELEALLVGVRRNGAELRDLLAVVLAQLEGAP